MSWDEKLFGRVFRLLQRREPPKRGVPFEPRRAELTLLASAIAERPVTLTTARGEGSSLFVPEVLDGPDEAWMYRVIHQAMALRLGLTAPPSSPEEDVRASLDAVGEIQRALFEELPGARELFDRVAPKTHAVELFGLLPRPATAKRAVKMARGAEGASGTERKARNVKAERRIDLQEDKNGENPLVHSFEKVHTAEEYKGGRKRADASDEMAEHGEALDELSIEEVVRSKQRARSLYRADLNIEGQIVETDETGTTEGFLYDEWDDAKRTYRKQWCSVFERVAGTIDPARAAAEVRALVAKRSREIRIIEAELARIDRAHAPRPRQPEGSELDLEAIVDRHAALAASSTPPDKLYVSRRRRPPDVDVLVLLDASLSTDAWVQNRRVIDVARQSIVVLGAALHGARVRTMIAAFHSNTRRDCRFVIAKRFDDSWALAARRLLSIEPTGYTRVGPALRHGTAKLVESGARRRVLLLISDAKPTDTDQYEGRYGIADVRQAVREARAEAVDILALAIESTARVHFTQMFGAGRHALLRRPDELPTALGRVFLELSR